MAISLCLEVYGNRLVYGDLDVVGGEEEEKGEVKK